MSVRLRNSLATLCVVSLLSSVTWFGCTSANRQNDNPPSTPIDPIPPPATSTTGGSSTTTTTSGGGTSGSQTTTTTTGTTTGTFVPRDILTGLNNPTRMADFGGFVFALVGFNSGQNNGRLIRFAIDTRNNESGTDGVQPKVITASNTSPLQATFTNPFDVITDNANGALFVTDGFNVNNGGRVLRVTPTAQATEFSVRNLTANATTPQNPAFMTFEAPFLFVSEFGGNNVGQVRRIDLTDPNTPVVVVFANNLTFPADLATDGAFLYVAEAGNNAVVRFNLNAPNASLPLDGSVNGTNVQRITAAQGAQQMRQPFELVVNAAGDIYVEEGQGLTLGGLAPLGTANGQIQIIPAGTQEAQDIGTGTSRLTGLTNPSGLEVTRLPGGTQDQLVFTESIGTPNGNVRSVFVNPANRTVVSNTVIDTGLNNPFDVITALPGDASRLFYTVNFDGGTPNGSVRGGDFE